MKLPEGKTEQDVMDAVDKTVRAIAKNFSFGIYSEEDIRQEAWVFALELLENDKYDPARPLDNFIYTHIRNRLINLKRNKLRRNDAPCAKCHNGQPCVDGDGVHRCSRYQEWFRRQQAKANLMKPFDLSNLSDERESNTRVNSTVFTDAEINEARELIDRELPVELRPYWLKMRDGVAVSKTMRLEVEKRVALILKGTIECLPSEDD